MSIAKLLEVVRFEGYSNNILDRHALCCYDLAEFAVSMKRSDRLTAGRDGRGQDKSAFHVELLGARHGADLPEGQPAIEAPIDSPTGAGAVVLPQRFLRVLR
jgi:hypothetical protein